MFIQNIEDTFRVAVIAVQWFRYFPQGCQTFRIEISQTRVLNKPKKAKLKAQLGQKLAHAETFDRGVALGTRLQ